MKLLGERWVGAVGRFWEGTLRLIGGIGWVRCGWRWWLGG